MKNDIKKNILIADDEKIYKEFPKLSGIDSICQVIITTKRLIIYTQGHLITSNRKVKKRSMNDIDLKSITHTEYYLEYIKNSFFIKLLGFVLTVGAFVLAYGVFKKLLNVPTYTYSYILNYVILFFFLIIGLVLMLKVKKILYFKVISGFNIITELQLRPTKYNEEALRYLASKFY
ncbi:MAG: hypothetical protein WC152_05420 [Candidatus Izemoplasmatales bacterium]